MNLDKKILELIANEKSDKELAEIIGASPTSFDVIFIASFLIMFHA